MPDDKPQTTAHVARHFTQDEARRMWRALVEIGFADFDAGPTPIYIRDHAKAAVQNV